MPHGTGETVELGAASRIKWVLFCLMVTTVPVLYFMFVIGGFLPLIAIAASVITSLTRSICIASSIACSPMACNRTVRRMRRLESSEMAGG